MSEEKLTCYDLTSENVEEIQRRENEEDYRKLAIQSQQIEDITKSLNELINDGAKHLDEIDDTVIDSYTAIDDINIDLEQAKKTKIKGMLLKGTVISTCIGFAVGGIAGGVIGSYLGSVGIGFLLGSIPVGGLSGGTTYGIIKKKADNADEVCL
jgi:hypothetical protein